MGKTAGRILKSGNVKLEGQFHLDVAQAKLRLPEDKGVALAAPQVRIVENHPGFAVIEVTCCCGKRTHLKCEYTGTHAPEGSGPVLQ